MKNGQLAVEHHPGFARSVEADDAVIAGLEEVHAGPAARGHDLAGHYAVRQHVDQRDRRPQRIIAGIAACLSSTVWPLTFMTMRRLARSRCD